MTKNPPARWPIRLAGALSLVLLAAPVESQNPAPWKDPSPHRTQFVTVEKDVKLEVLDWGGSGPSLLLLAGGGNTAHVFDDFAPKLTAQHHVYGVTRRGFGASGYATASHPVERLGEDVLAVLDALQLKRTILVGHSIGGAELSWVANHHPERVAALVYLEAGYSYAFDNGKGSNIMEMQKLQAPQPPPPEAADLSSFPALQNYYERVDGFRFPEAELRQQNETTGDGKVGDSRDVPGGHMLGTIIMDANPTKFTEIPARALFIFANPHATGAWADHNPDPAIQTADRTYSTAITALTTKQVQAVEAALPSAQVITLAGANHYVFLTNEAEVLRAIRTFTSGLPRN